MIQSKPHCLCLVCIVLSIFFLHSLPRIPLLTPPPHTHIFCYIFVHFHFRFRCVPFFVVYFFCWRKDSCETKSLQSADHPTHLPPSLATLFLRPDKRHAHLGVFILAKWASGSERQLAQPCSQDMDDVQSSFVSFLAFSIFF